MSTEDREFLENSDENPAAQMHHEFGMSLRNDWSLWEKDMPLVKLFNERGITLADDMSAIILTSLWRRVRGVDLDLDGQIKSYQDYCIRNIGKACSMIDDDKSRDSRLFFHLADVQTAGFSYAEGAPTEAMIAPLTKAPR